MALSRKQSREVAFRLLFSLAAPNDDELNLACPDDKPTGPELQYIQGLVTAVTDNITEIDEIISSYCQGFTLERLVKTDLTALRLAIGEIKFFGHTPTAVALNEAVEIAKKYGSEKSGGFVNGVLATFVKEHGDAK